MPRLIRITAAWLFAVLLLSSTATGNDLHERIVRPERSDTPFGGERYLEFLGQAGSTLERFARVGEPTLAYAVLEPRDYGLEYHYQRQADELGMRFEFRTPSERLPPPVRGTVVLLHGWTMDASTQGLWGLALAEHGYRTVLVDLRNHGFSGDAPAGFGLREGDDVAALVAYLRDQKRVAEPVHLFGTSYGAVTALRAAANPDLDIRSVVAMEPFANAAESVRQYVRLLKSGSAGGWRGRALGWWLRRTVQDAAVDEALRRAGDDLGLDLDALDTADALAATRACVLLLHGAEDRLVPVATARELARTAPARVQFAELPDENHFSLPARIDWLQRPLLDWLALTADAGAACPALTLPTDPLDIARLPAPSRG